MSIEYKWQGAEARVGVGSFFGRTVIYKERVKKAYRHPQLDQRLTSRRVLQEVRCMTKAGRNGVRVPAVLSVDLQAGRFVMELIGGTTLKQAIAASAGEGPAAFGSQLGRLVAQLHNLDIIHGDLTSSNVLHTGSELVLIDFGLAYGSNLVEDKAVDLYVLERALTSTHPLQAKGLFAAAVEAYGQHNRNSKAILRKLADVQLRGRKREMIG